MKAKKILFDRLQLVSKDKKGSKWTGDMGNYVFVRLEGKKPFAKLILNRKFLSGIFPTKKKGVFSGDFKTGEEKVYLSLVTKSKSCIEIYKKVA